MSDHIKTVALALCLPFILLWAMVLMLVSELYFYLRGVGK